MLITVLVVLSVIMACSPSDVLNVNSPELALNDEFVILYEVTPFKDGEIVTKESLLKTVKILEGRASKLGIRAKITIEAANRIRLKLDGVTDEDGIRKQMKEPAIVTFRSKDGTETDADQYNKIEMIGTDFAENAAKIEFNQMNEPIVSIKVKSKDKFAEVTQRLIGQPLAIYMNDTLISAPVVQAVLTDRKSVV